MSLLELSAAELIARGIAPIKKEYRLGAIRYTSKPDPSAAAAAAPAAASDTAAAATADDALEAAGASAAGRSGPVVAADGEGGHKRVKSKKQRRKERHDRNQGRLCVPFMLGRCTYGDTCKFSHDVEAYLASKAPDLPGPCPFSNSSDKCPYGLSCRWAGTHPSQDAPASNGAAAAAAVAGAAGTSTDGQQQQQQQQQQQSVPEGCVPESVCIAPFTHIQPALNTASRGLQEQLRKKSYNFSRANRVVAEVRQLVGGGGGGNANSKRQQGSKASQQQQRQNAVTEVSNGPAAKRQKVDAAAAAAAPADVVMQDAAAAAGAGVKASPSPPAAASSAPAASDSVAAAAAAAAAAAVGEVDDLDELYAADPVCPITPHNSLEIGTVGTPAAAATTTAGTVQPSDAALIAALQQEQQQQKKQQQQQEQQQQEQQQQQQQQQRQAQQPGAVGGVVDAGASEPRSRPVLDISGKTYLAPLTTVGNLPFRRVCVDLGCEITCGEMSLASNLLTGQGSEWALLKRHPSEKFFGVQVCGGYTDQMAQVAQLLDEQLGDNIDFVDINCGCPIDVICSKGAGSSLLLKPRRLEEVVRGVTSCINKPVIVKIRKGYYDNADVAHDIIPQLPLWGAAGVTLHGRSRQQRYSRAADWDYIRRCAGVASSVGLPLIGNGDVFGPSEWRQRLAAAAAEPEDDGREGPAAAAAASAAGSAGGGCGVTTAMIGRAALIKPWIFTEIREDRLWDISANERLDLIRSFVSHGLEAWGSDDRGVETTRRFLLEWMSFTHRYIPVGLLEVVPQVMSWRPPAYATRSQLEGLLSSEAAADWVKISEMFLGPAPSGFTFVPKHKTNAYTLTADALAQMAAGGSRGTQAAAAVVGQEEEEEGEENG